MKRYTLILSCILVLLLMLLAFSRSVIAGSGDNYDLSWNTLFSGGATSGSAYTMDGAIGQPFVAKTSASPYELCAGYLCGVQAERRVYLPLVRK